MRAALLVIAGCSAAPVPAVHNAAPVERGLVLTDDWKAVCQERLSAAADDFRHRAPSIYPDYAELGWTLEPEISSSDAYARVRLDPGRSWSFIASAAPRDVAAEDRVDAALIKTDAWARLDGFGYAVARHHGPLSLVVIVETERSAVPLAKHPLVVAFVEAAKAALDTCGS